MQGRVLALMSTLDIGWALSGGAALTGFHLGHRVTEDLDFFFHGRSGLDEIPRVVEAHLRAGGFEVTALQRSPGFVRYRVDDGREGVVLDLVADPVPVIEEPVCVGPGLVVDTPHEILVNKLWALVSRSELRDLEDVRVLIERGGDLQRALSDAPRKDGGFSPMTLAWLLPQLPMARAADLGFDHAALGRFRDHLVQTLSTEE